MDTKDEKDTSGLLLEEKDEFEDSPLGDHDSKIVSRVLIIGGIVLALAVLMLISGIFLPSVNWI